jgi:hypothetical protein
VADIPYLRRNVKEEEIRYRASISESTFYKIGGSVNFINTYQYFQFYFGMMGPYSFLSTPFNGVGTIEVFDYDAEIVQIWVTSMTSGSGTTQVDIKKAALNSSSYSTIFSTKPSVSSSTPSDSVFDMNGEATLPSGCVRPVLVSANFNAGDKLRLDVDSVMGSGARDLQIQIFWRPR